MSGVKKYPRGNMIELTVLYLLDQIYGFFFFQLFETFFLKLNF